MSSDDTDDININDNEKSCEKPRRPCTCYFMYMVEMRHVLKDKYKIKNENNKVVIDIKKLSKNIGQMWKELPEEEKDVWKKKAAKEFEKYKINLEKWKKNNPMEVRIEKEMKQTLRDIKRRMLNGEKRKKTT